MIDRPTSTPAPVQAATRRDGPSPTIADVARLAGVGKGTVSRVLNGGLVSDATRGRVEHVIAALEFSPSSAGRSLARGRDQSAAVVVPFVTHPSAVSRVQGVIEALRPSGLPVSILDVETPDHAAAHLRTLARLRPEAVVVVSLVPQADDLARLTAEDIPVVWLDAFVEGHASLSIDNVAGGRLATDHLIALGHTSIAFIGDDTSDGFGFPSATEREHGFVAAMNAAGLAPGRRVAGPHSATVAERLATELLTTPHPPTGIVTTSDTQAMGVLAAARTLGIAVPDRLSVVGFDDIELAAMAGLTTVRQPIVESGRLAGRMILAARRGEHDRSHVELPLELIERSSTGVAPNDAGASISNQT